MPPPRNNKLIRSLLQNSRPPIFFMASPLFVRKLHDAVKLKMPIKHYANKCHTFYGTTHVLVIWYVTLRGVLVFGAKHLCT